VSDSVFTEKSLNSLCRPIHPPFRPFASILSSGHCIASHRGARRGGLQAWWERRPGLQVPEVLIEASANIVEKTESVWVIAIRRLVSPAAGGLPLLL
jgi:hypothetical protein